MEIQLEFNFSNLSKDEVRLLEMQKMIDEFCDSMGKVRRKLFAELGDVKKQLVAVQEENRLLKETIRRTNGEKTVWLYRQNEHLCMEEPAVMSL